MAAKPSSELETGSIRADITGMQADHPDHNGGPADVEAYLTPAIVGAKEGHETRVRKGFWKTARKAAKRIPFMEDVVAAYYCALDPTTPSKVRGTLLAALAYFVLPLDVVPDFIVGLGFGDDATVLLGVLTVLRNHIRDDHREAAREALEIERPEDGGPAAET